MIVRHKRYGFIGSLLMTSVTNYFLVDCGVCEPMSDFEVLC